MDRPTQGIVLSLLTIHLVLHLLSARVERRVRLAIIYLFVQAILLFYAQTVSNYSILLMFMVPLLSEIVIIFEALWLVPITVVLFYLLHLVSQLLMFASSTFQGVSIQVQLYTVSQAMIVGLLTLSTPVAAYFLLIRSRQHTGSLLVRLDSAHRQLAVYAEQVEQLTVTAERARMARELHDTLAQGLAGLILQLEALESQIERGDNERSTATLLQIKNRARTTLKDSRLVIDDLRLMPNQPTMIISSITDEAHYFSTSTGVPCTVSIPPSLTLPTSTTEHTIRFVTEGLANVAKHAAATKVSVQLKEKDREFLLEIRDDGVGFDPEASMRKHGHYGLLGLQERARLVGGRFEIESAQEKGTTLRLYLPKPH
jgi:two-component system, NarL family, sensor histidine kinase YdfH